MLAAAAIEGKKTSEITERNMLATRTSHMSALPLVPQRPQLQYPTNDPHNRQLPSKAGEKCEVIVIPRLPAPRAIVVDLMVFSEL